MKELNIEVKIEEINVTKDWYEIHFKYSLNGELWKHDLYDGDYENGNTPKQWKKILESGLALKYAMEKISDQEDFEK